MPTWCSLAPNVAVESVLKTGNGGYSVTVVTRTNVPIRMRLNQGTRLHLALHDARLRPSIPPTHSACMQLNILLVLVTVLGWLPTISQQ